MKTLIEVKELNYGTILDHVSLKFYENTIHYISGSNNCGKTTFIKLLSGEIDSESYIFYQGKDIHQMSCYEMSQMIGTVITLDKDFNFSTVSQEILYKLDRLNLEKSEHKKRYQYIVSLLKLNHILNKNILELNDYQKLKVLLAIELITKPKVLLLGDVFTYIRKKDQEDILSLLKKVENLSIIIFSNDLELALYSDYLHLFHKGKLILSGDTIEVLKKDSIINKLGLDLPFMVDLSLKLKYYDLVDDIELDMNRMVNNLWK